MNIAAGFFGMTGLTLFVLLLTRQGADGILQLLHQAGWPLLLLLPYHAVPLLLDAKGWQLLLAPGDKASRAPLPVLLWIATIREAINRLLPVANIGGEIVGIRMVTSLGVAGVDATASVIIETVLTLISQYLFAALGVMLLMAQTGRNAEVGSILAGLALSAPVPILLGSFLRYGSLFSKLEWLVGKLFGDRKQLLALSGGASLDIAILALWRRPRALLATVVWQLAGMVAGAFETWLALRLLGHPVPPALAIALEALILAVRSIAFMVPAGLGVQEAALILSGAVFGVGGDVALSLSLVKRMREIGFGLPALMSWQIYISRKLRPSKTMSPGIWTKES